MYFAFKNYYYRISGFRHISSVYEVQALHKRVLTVISIVLVVSVALVSFMIWNFYRYETTVLSLSYETEPMMSSPLSDVNCTWQVKAYSSRVFGNSPFDGNGYIHRERVMSENRFRYSEFNNLNASLRLKFHVVNATGYMLCNETLDTADGCDREVVFEFKPDHAKAGSTLQIRITIFLNVQYEYGAGREGMQFTLEKEWTRTMQIQQSEPVTGEQFWE